jgi:hypothetical protein
VKQLSSALYAKARTSLVTFAAIVGRDERTGKHIILQPFHREILRGLQTLALVAIFAGAELGKSYLLALCLAWTIARDPSLRCAIVSATLGQAERLFRLVVGIMSSSAFQQVFPQCRIEKASNDELFVTGRSPGQKDPNLRATGYSLSSTLGARIEYLALDDIVTRESLLTPQTRDRAYLDFVSVMLTRLAPDGRIALVNTREHEDDLPSRLVKLPGWNVLSFPILDEHGQSIWPERHSLEHIASRRAALGERRWLTSAMCQPAPEGAAIFAEQDIARALANGLATQYSDVPDGKVILACDPAWTTKITSDLSAIALIVVEPGPFFHLSHLETWKLPAEQLINRIVALAQTSKASAVVEANAAGQSIAESVSRRGVPCKAFPITRASKEFAVESLSSQLSAGKWCFRQPLGSPGPELLALRSDLLTFSWDSHTGDRLSALLVGQSAIREITNRPRGGFHHIDLLSR